MIERADPGAPPIVLGARFNGPLRMANGGYACGSLAAALGLPLGPVSVRLHRPVPLETALRLAPAAEGRDATAVTGSPAKSGVAALWSGDALIATAERAQLRGLRVPDPPARPDRDAAEDARSRHHDFGPDHPLGGCFVCSEYRTDGLHVSAGPIAGDGTGDVVATPFEPDGSFGADGVVDPAVVWAALDCPSYPMSAMRAGQTSLLGTFRAEIGRDVRVGERLVVVGWTTRLEGRKHLTSSALLDGAGAVLGAAEAVWIGLPDDYVWSAGG